MHLQLYPFPAGAGATLMILLANSTPMVCDERTRHSFLTKRCRRHDLGSSSAAVARISRGVFSRGGGWPKPPRAHSLPRSARTQ